MASGRRMLASSRQMSSSLPTADWRLRYILAVRAADAPAPGPADDESRDMTSAESRGASDMVSHGPESTHRQSAAASPEADGLVVGSIPRAAAPLALRHMARRRRMRHGGAAMSPPLSPPSAAPTPPGRRESSPSITVPPHVVVASPAGLNLTPVKNGSPASVSSASSGLSALLRSPVSGGRRRAASSAAGPSSPYHAHAAGPAHLAIRPSSPSASPPPDDRYAEPSSPDHRGGDRGGRTPSRSPPAPVPPVRVPSSSLRSKRRSASSVTRTSETPSHDMDIASASPSAASSQPSTAHAHTGHHAGPPPSAPRPPRPVSGLASVLRGPQAHHPTPAPAPVASSLPSEDSPGLAPLADATDATPRHRRSSGGSLDSAVNDGAAAPGAYSAFASATRRAGDDAAPASGPGTLGWAAASHRAPLDATGPSALHPDAASPTRMARRNRLGSDGDHSRGHHRGLSAAPSMGLLGDAFGQDPGSPVALGHGESGTPLEEDDEDDDDMVFAFGDDRDDGQAAGTDGWGYGPPTPRAPGSRPGTFVPPHELARLGRGAASFSPSGRPE